MDFIHTDKNLFELVEKYCELNEQMTITENSNSKNKRAEQYGQLFNQICMYKPYSMDDLTEQIEKYADTKLKKIVLILRKNLEGIIKERIEGFGDMKPKVSMCDAYDDDMEYEELDLYGVNKLLEIYEKSEKTDNQFVELTQNIKHEVEAEVNNRICKNNLNVCLEMEISGKLAYFLYWNKS